MRKPYFITMNTVTGDVCIYDTEKVFRLAKDIQEFITERHGSLDNMTWTFSNHVPSLYVNNWYYCNQEEAEKLSNP